MLSQEDDFEDVDEAAFEDTADEGGFGGDEPPASAEEVPAAPADAPESYVVQPGDTLWDLSERFLNNPWYWPKIWSYNPELTNPNWIRPGTRIRFYPGATAEPVVVAEEEFDPGDFELDEDFEDVPLFEDRGFVAPVIGEANAETRRREFFISDRDIDAAARIRNAPEEKELLSVFDRVYLDMEQRPEAGRVLETFEVARDLIHPVTGANLGKVVHTTGLVRVDRPSEEQSLGTLVQTWDAVVRGTYAANLERVDIDSVTPRRNEKDMQGYIVEAARYPADNIGQNEIIFIDRGRADEVLPGNTFVVVRSGDPFTNEYRGMVDEDIGRLMVVDVGGQGSTAVVLGSSRELVTGDRIEMREGE